LTPNQSRVAAEAKLGWPRRRGAGLAGCGCRDRVLACLVAYLTYHTMPIKRLSHLPKISRSNSTSHFIMAKRILPHFYKSLIGGTNVIG
jgi:hypothetical protein